ncbi:MAG: hypothetical protein IKK59_01475 [Lachnospiraceae bacterium]|nr:hypothetical protein [Lachnospiraceae bacterium]
MRIDEFFDKQPDAQFIDELRRPYHSKPPKHLDRRELFDGEVYVKGIYIRAKVAEWDEVLATAYEDFASFLAITGIAGEEYPINIIQGEAASEGAFTISVKENHVDIIACEAEGVRRAIFYLEEEMIKREGPILSLGDIVRVPGIRRRITRGFFSPTNRAPKWGDELLDDTDYYPDEYLNRLAHNGTNGLWIYTSFAQLVRSPYMPGAGDDCERRMEKLRAVVEKCKRYGIKVYVFAIEPMGLFPEEVEKWPELIGVPATNIHTRHPICLRMPKAREHVIYCVEYIFKSIPELGGYIDITAGERVTNCASVGTFTKCPRCAAYSRGENLAYAVDVIKEGLRRANTGAEFISWTYGHRFWENDDISEYIEKATQDVIVMQNFEDGGIDMQLGKLRAAYDYWLSYPGPSEMFSASAMEAKRYGKEIYAKMQVCSSHEMATVPYIPVPGILFDKYKRARELGVSGIMECWYFGNYPSIMNRASTELSYLDNFEDKKDFLRELAARIYGSTYAEQVTEAWSAFEEAYRHYPTNIMFSYYGPMHDGVVWELSALPKNRMLPRSWQLLDPPDGDRMGECLFRGHTLDEAVVLLEKMCHKWEQGQAFLPAGMENEFITCQEAIGVLLSSGYHILQFYKLREKLGEEQGNPWKVLEEMEQIVHLEIENSKRMIELCKKDPRLGYHSEAEGFKFFEEKLKARISKLRALFDADFKEIKMRLLSDRHALGYYYAEGFDAYPLGTSAEAAKEIELEGNRTFSAYIENQYIKLNINCDKDDDFSVCYEFSLFHPECEVIYVKDTNSSFVNFNSTKRRDVGLALAPSVVSLQGVWGDGVKNELSNYGLETLYEGERVKHILSTRIPEDKWNGKTAIKLGLRVGNAKWKATDTSTTLGQTSFSPEEFGFLLPVTEFELDK